METPVKQFKNQEERKKILDRIKKILAVANGSSFEAEADTAMKMAQSYMRQYGLSMTDVELNEELASEIVHDILNDSKLKTETWSRMLAGAVAHIFDCQFVLVRQRPKDRLSFIGYKQDIEMAKLVLDSLYLSIRLASRSIYPNDRSLRTDFRMGAGTRILERAIEEKKKDRKESDRYALIVVEKSNRVKTWTEENLNVSRSPIKNRRMNVNAYDRGRSHANNLDLSNRAKVSQNQTIGIGYSK